MIDDTTTYYVMCEGDPSVGINGQSAEIKVWSADEDQDYTKQLITEMFGKLWDEPVRIITDAELEEADRVEEADLLLSETSSDSVTEVRGKDDD